MGKSIYIECLSGISGDMTIGALLDLGADVEAFKKSLDLLNLKGYHIEINKKSKNGIYGSKFDVVLDDHKQVEMHSHSHENHTHEHHTHERTTEHDHGHKHEHTVEHTHKHAHSHDDKGAHYHRNLTSITEMIQVSALSDAVKTMSIAIFNEVAKAEAKIHNSTLDEVHFHEVGAVDSIIDIVGTAILIEQLDIDHVMTSPVHVGTGFVKCDHGKIPVPAPATLEILKGIPIYSKGIRSELVTPTGAAIIKVLTSEFMERPSMVIESIGYGIATKDLDIANLLRVSVIKESKKKEQIWVIESNIDDMNGEIYTALMEALLSLGVKDVNYQSIYMKKNRPGIKVSVLCEASMVASVEMLLFRETTTFGIRKYPVERSVLKRSFKTIDTEVGAIDFKFAYQADQLVKITPEYESLKAIAQTSNRSLIDLYAFANAYIEKELK